MVKEGIIRPFRLGSTGDPVTGSGEELRTSRVQTVIGTRCAHRQGREAGELRWKQLFGSRLDSTLRLATFNAVRQPLAHVHTADALARSLTDEVLDHVDVTPPVDDETLVIDVYTRSRTTRSSAAPALQSVIRVRGV